MKLRSLIGPVSVQRRHLMDSLVERRAKERASLQRLGFLVRPKGFLQLAKNRETCKQRGTAARRFKLAEWSGTYQKGCRNVAAKPRVTVRACTLSLSRNVSHAKSSAAACRLFAEELIISIRHHLIPQHSPTLAMHPKQYL